MAKTCMIMREETRCKKSRLSYAKRQALKKIINNIDIEYEEKVAAVNKLNKMPRDTNIIRIKRRCRCCGRPRAVYRKFQLCRICLRNLMVRGDITGLVKSSW